jgi:uncharacterized membrane protein
MGRTARLIAAIGVGVGLTLVAGAAAARPTGGSMGGGSFGHSSSSGGSHSSGGYPSSYPSSGGSHSSGGSLSSDDTGTVFALMFGSVFVLILVGVAQDSVDARARARRDRVAAARASVDVTVLHVGLDARARPFVQRELARIAEIADTATADGRMTMLREVALLLRRLRSSWLYGGAYNEPLETMGGAESTFHHHVDDARARFTHEVVHNEQGVVTRAATPDLVTSSDDGPGIVLVTIVVAAGIELFTIGEIADGEDLRKALEGLSNLTSGALVAVEVVWMPAADRDHLSSVELEVAYPPPAIYKLEGAIAGKVFCGYCGCPYPAEALSCPNCGGRPAQT